MNCTQCNHDKPNTLKHQTLLRSPCEQLTTTCSTFCACVSVHGQLSSLFYSIPHALQPQCGACSGSSQLWYQDSFFVSMQLHAAQTESEFEAVTCMPEFMALMENSGCCRLPIVSICAPYYCRLRLGLNKFGLFCLQGLILHCECTHGIHHCITHPQILSSFGILICLHVQLAV